MSTVVKLSASDKSVLFMVYESVALVTFSIKGRAIKTLKFARPQARSLYARYLKQGFIVA